MLTLGPEPRIVTFDCYGSLVQWHQALLDAVRTILSRQAGSGKADDDEVATVAERVGRKPSYGNSSHHT